MENDYNKQVGLRIKKLREKKGEFQKDTANAITKQYGENLSEGQLGLYEIGARKVPSNIVAALAKYFNTTSDYILGITKNEKPIEIAASTKNGIDLSDVSDRDKEIIMNIINTSKKDND